ncbi:MAG TPA: amidohydrolase family protein [Tepidisphaeraceae bacterium]|jgi:guanine deaminase
MAVPAVLRGPILNPKADRTIDFLPDGVLAADERGRVTFVGPWPEFVARFGTPQAIERIDGLLLPPMLDLHTHVPQHPIRGRFCEGVPCDAAEGRLIAGLNRNVFPAEMRFEDLDDARRVVDAFAADTLRNGVAGGSVFLTVHAEASFDALHRLGPLWHGGLVLMDQNCPVDLRNGPYVQPDLRNLAESLGKRLVVTDRFAVATSSGLRKYGASVAREFELLTQTHLNEQLSEKEFVETVLYPDAESYTHVYLRDGLLDTRPILAHCVHMTEPEWAVLQSRHAVVAHCPTSNALLGSGIMKLDDVAARGIDYAICTDVGASPTTSLLAEMAMFLLVHRGRHDHATACEALWRTTLAPARVLNVADQVGTFEPGSALSYAIARVTVPPGVTSAEDVIRRSLLDLGGFTPRTTAADLDDLATGTPSHATLAALTADAATLAKRLEGRFSRVVLAGQQMFPAT